MLTFIMLILILSIDTFVAAITYEGSQIKIPFSSNLIISFICSLSLIISLFLGNLCSNILPKNILKYFSFLILFSIGTLKIINNYIKKLIKSHQFKNKKLNINLGSLTFIIEIYGDYKKADYDKSKKLSNFEAIFLALALSIDSLISGIAFHINYIYFIPIFVFNLLINVLVIISSKLLHFKFDFSKIGGLLLIILSLSKL